MKNFFLVFSMMGCLATMHAQRTDLALQAYDLRMNGHPYEALSFLDSTLALHPDSARLWFEKGRTLDWVKVDGCTKFIHAWFKMAPKLRKSSKCLKKAYQLDPGNARYHNWYSGIAAVQSLLYIYSPWKWPLMPSKLRSAVNHAEKAMYLSPENHVYRLDFITYARLGWVIGGKPRKAKIQADTLAMLDPYYGLKAQEALNDGKKNTVPFQSYLELVKEQPDNLALLHDVAERSIRRDSASKVLARQYLRHILELEPGDRRALLQLVKSAPPAENEEMLALINAYIAIHKEGLAYNLSAGYTALGFYYKRAGELALSEEMLAKANELYPDRFDSFMKDQAVP